MRTDDLDGRMRAFEAALDPCGREPRVETGCRTRGTVRPAFRSPAPWGMMGDLRSPALDDRMLLTITTTHRPATDLGYLLHKHPERFQSFDLSFGKAHVFYPEASAERCTACLLLDVDPVGMVRGKGSGRGPAGPVRQRPALRRLVVPERGDLPGLRLGPPGSLQGPARTGDHRDSAGGPDRRAAGAGRRAIPAGRLRAAGLRGRGRPAPARRAVPRVGREPVLLGDRSARRRRSRTC